MEVSSQATPFEHRSFGEELALCRRYYYQPDLASDRMISMVLRPDNKRQFQHFFCSANESRPNFHRNL